MMQPILNSTNNRKKGIELNQSQLSTHYSLLTIKLLLRFLCFLEIQHHTIDAVA